MKSIIRFYVKTICILLIGIIFSSCTSLRPKYKGEPYEEKNQIVTFNNPYYVERMNILGWTLNLGFSAGFGYAVYQYAPYDYKVGTLSKNDIRIGQSVLAGLLTGFLIYEFSSDGNKHEFYFYSESKEWLRKFDDDLIMIESYSNSYIKAIPDDADEDFNFYSANDASLFKTFFPNSKYTSDVIRKSIPNLNSSELPAIVGLFPYSEAGIDVIREYYNRTGKLDEWLKAVELYPSLQKEYNYKAVLFTRDVYDAKKLFSKVPYDDELKKQIENKLYNVNNLTEANEFITLFPNSEYNSNIQKNSLSYINSFKDVESYFDMFPNPNDISSLEDKAINHINTTQDLLSFSSLFPNSSRADEAIEKTLPNIKRKDLPQIINTFALSNSIKKLKLKYINESEDLNDCINSAELYPEYINEAAEKGKQFCTDLESQRQFLNTFGETDAAIDIRVKYNEEITKAPENLGNKVNSSYSESLPVISPDGETLYFTRLDDPDGYGGYDIYYSELGKDNEWGEAVNIGTPLNNKGHSAVYSISPDGNFILLHNLYSEIGDGTSISYRLSEGWGYPNDLKMKNFYSLGTYHNATMSNDGKVIIISVKRYDSYGGNDLYVSSRNEDGSWTEPSNLGTTINTLDEESGPFLASDGVTLYFSSKGHGGFGGSDLFLTRRLDKSWKKWSKPENLGPTINSYGDEDFYVIPASGDFAYFASTKDSYGGKDIYRIGLPMDKRPNPVILIEGKVINAKTNEPVDAEIHYEDLTTGEELGIAHTNPSTGIYKIILPAGKKYGFRAEAPDFISVNDNVDLMNLKVYKKSVSDLQLVPIEKGQKARINNLFFDFGKAKLRKESFPELNRLVQILKDNPNIKLEVSGHTDNIGTDAVNMKLSDARAKSVVNYLISKGISKSKLIAKGYGPTKPVAPNDSEESRQKNRRVEILII